MPDAVIGGAGFVGSAIVRYLNECTETECIAVTRDNYHLWKGRNFRHIYWAAGTASKELCERDPDWCEEQNVRAVARAVQDFLCKKFIYVSSQAVFGKAEVGCDEWGSGYPEELSEYGSSKLAGEQEVWNRHDNVLILRPNGFTGPGLKKNAVHSFAKDPPELYYDWNSQVQFIHTDEFARIAAALAARYNNEAFNVAGEPVTMREIANIMDIPEDSVVIDPNRNPPPTVTAVMETTKLETALNELGIQFPSSSYAISNWNRRLPCLKQKNLGTRV
jgi:nucleoside-diphosphate-sugar epimerase